MTQLNEIGMLARDATNLILTETIEGYKVRNVAPLLDESLARRYIKQLSQAISDNKDKEKEYLRHINWIINIHFILCAHFMETREGIAEPGAKNFNLLYSAIYRRFSIPRDINPKYGTENYSLANLIWGLVNDHPFHDANKRTALLTLLYFLSTEKRVFKKDVTDVDLENCMLDIALKKMSVERLARFIKTKTARTKKRLSKSITYRELQRILRNFGYDMVNPKGNTIDIVKMSEHKKQRKRLFKLIEKCLKRKEQLRINVPFPGWSRQVSKGDLAKIREKLELTERFGVSSEVFYEKADPIPTLIGRYGSVLRRLADK